MPVGEITREHLKRVRKSVTAALPQVAETTRALRVTVRVRKRFDYGKCKRRRRVRKKSNVYVAEKNNKTTRTIITSQKGDVATNARQLTSAGGIPNLLSMNRPYHGDTA